MLKVISNNNLQDNKSGNQENTKQEDESFSCKIKKI